MSSYQQVSSGDILSSGISDLEDVLCLIPLSFARLLALHNGCNSVYSHYQCMWVSISSHYDQDLVSVEFPVCASLIAKITLLY